MMRLDLSKFFDEKLTHFQFSGEIDKSEIDLKEEGFEIQYPIQYEGEIFSLDGGDNDINIVVKYVYEEPCSLCLKSTKNQVETKLEGTLVEGTQEDFINDDSEEIEDAIYYERDSLDISKIVAEQIYISKPMKSVCSEECKGLCIICGVNLNDENCDCERDIVDPRLAGLKDFFPKE